MNEFQPARAWILSYLWFAIVFSTAYFTGTYDRILDAPLTRFYGPAWVASSLALFTYVFVAFWILYPRWSLLHKRRQSIFSVIFMAVPLGISEGTIAGMMWIQCQRIPFLSGMWATVLTFVIQGIWVPVWHRLVWERYLAPDHENPETMGLKTRWIHMPVGILMTLYVGVFESVLIFGFLEGFGNSGAVIGIHYPPPWSQNSADTSVVDSMEQLLSKVEQQL